MNRAKLTKPSRRSALWGAVGLLVLAVVLSVWWVGGGGGSSDEADGTAQSSSGSAGSDSDQETEEGVILDRDGVARETPDPGQTAPTEVATPDGKAPRPVRADLRDPVEVSDGVSVELVRFESVQGEGRGPAETSGPAVRVTISVRNDSSEPLDTQTAVLTAYFGPGDTPASDLSAPGARNLPLSVAAGDSATGRYVFRVPPADRDQMRFDFSFSTEVPKVIYSGTF